MTSSPPEFSLVLLTWNARPHLPGVFDSLASQTFTDFEVIIVDNGSSDETLGFVSEYEAEFPITIVENGSNLGFSEGINRGIAEASGEYICCYNHDTEFPEDYLETLADNVSPDTVWTTARINYRTSKTHQCVRLLGTERFPFPYVVDDLQGVIRVNYVPGDGLIVPRGVYERLDKQIFDPKLPSKGEDVYLSLQLRDKGIPMRAVLDTHSIHPDEGQYDLTMGNVVGHAANVAARFAAYRRSGLSLGDLVFIGLSSVTIPVRILTGSFPREQSELEERISETNI